MNWLTEKSILLISFVLSVFTIIFGYLSNSNQCYMGYKQCESVVYSLFIFVPIFIISLISKNSNQYFLDMWKKFIIWFAPISIILITISSRSPGDLFPVYKKTVLFISLIILILAYGFIYFRSKYK